MRVPLRWETSANPAHSAQVGRFATTLFTKGIAPFPTVNAIRVQKTPSAFALMKNHPIAWGTAKPRVIAETAMPAERTLVRQVSVTFRTASPERIRSIPIQVVAGYRCEVDSYDFHVRNPAGMSP